MYLQQTLKALNSGNGYRIKKCVLHTSHHHHELEKKALVFKIVRHNVDVPCVGPRAGGLDHACAKSNKMAESAELKVKRSFKSHLI